MRVGVVNKNGDRLADRYSDGNFFAGLAEENPDRIYFLPECWENWIASFRYKPGWSFDYDYAIDFDQEWLYIDARVEDVYEPGKLIRISRKFVLDPKMGEEDAKMFIRACVISVELHEVDEWITFDGVREFDPHKDEQPA